MSQAERAWQLVRGDELVAELVVTGGDFPWLIAKVRPAAGLAEVRPLSDEELRQLELLDEDRKSPDLPCGLLRKAIAKSGRITGACPGGADARGGRQPAGRTGSAAGVADLRHRRDAHGKMTV